MIQIITFVALMAGAGYGLKRIGLVSPKAPDDLSKLVFNFTLPPLIFTALQEVQLQWTVAVLPLAGWLVVGIGVLLGLFLIKTLKVKGPDRGALLLTIAFANSTFLGYPLIQGFYGNQALGLAAFYDLLGAMLAANTIGIFIGISTSPDTKDQRAPATPTNKNRKDNNNNQTPTRLALQRLLRLPPVWALIISLALRPVTIPQSIKTILDQVGSLTVPLIMLAMGMNLRFRNWRERLPLVGLIVVSRLILIPLVTLAILAPTTIPMEYKKVIILQAAMPSMFNSYLMGNLFKLNTDMIINTIVYSTILSFITLPLWFKVLGG